MQNSNKIAKTMFVFDTVQKIGLAVVFMGFGIAMEYMVANYQIEGNRSAVIAAGALFIVIGLVVAIVQMFTWNRVMKGPTGTATEWFKNYKRKQNLQAQMLANKTGKRKNTIRIKF